MVCDLSDNDRRYGSFQIASSNSEIGDIKYNNNSKSSERVLLSVKCGSKFAIFKDSNKYINIFNHFQSDFGDLWSLGQGVYGQLGLGND